MGKKILVLDDMKEKKFSLIHTLNIHILIKINKLLITVNEKLNKYTLPSFYQIVNNNIKRK